VKSAEALLNKGAKKVYACSSHPVFSGPAVQRIQESCLEEVVVTNSIPVSRRRKGPARSGFSAWPTYWVKRSNRSTKKVQ
jgi:ribose-phosphate pyrophosphokinase